MRFKRPSAAWIVAVTALLLTMGTGTAVGARTLITGKQIKDRSITGRDIKDRSLKTADLAVATRKAMTGPAGPAGPSGPAGPVGPAGPPGPSQLGAITRVEQDGTVAAGDINHVTATCPSGQGIISGAFITAGGGVVFSEDSFGGSDSWSVLYDNSGVGSSATVDAIAYCATKGQAASPRSATSVDSAIARLEAQQRAAH